MDKNNNNLLKDKKTIIKGKRFIGGYDDSTNVLNPYILNYYELKKSEYFSKLYINNDDNTINFITNNIKDKISLDENIYINPALLLSYEIFGKLCDTSVIYENKEFTVNDESGIDYEQIYCTVEYFIKSNFEDIKNNNKILSKFLHNLFYFKYKQISESEIDEFINKWFKNKEITSFYLDLGNDLEKYLSNKYD